MVDIVLDAKTLKAIRCAAENEARWEHINNRWERAYYTLADAAHHLQMLEEARLKNPDDGPSMYSICTD